MIELKTEKDQREPEVNPNPAILSTQRAAAYLGTTVGMLTLSRHTGELFKGVPGPKFIKLGARTVRYLRKDLDAWIAQHHRYTSNAEVAVSRKL